MAMWIAALRRQREHRYGARPTPFLAMDGGYFRPKLNVTPVFSQSAESSFPRSRRRIDVAVAPPGAALFNAFASA